MIAAILAAVACTAPYVVDGDTLQCDVERVRLYGVDAPELAHVGRPAQPWAVDARRRLEALTRGPVVCVQAGNGRDRYGRLVARCTALPAARGEAGTPDLGRQLVREGLASDYRRYNDGRYAADERDARLARRGIWSDLR